ncbi:MAG: hypothetical protein HUJ54_02870 [Erysipelotrichaceae bacterium]|nr:hypothetical protein [Erysipelotrichaceae bacterium]
MNYHQLREFLICCKEINYQEWEDDKGTPVILMDVISENFRNLDHQVPAQLIIVQHDPFSRRMILGIMDSRTNELLSSCSGRLAERFLDSMFDPEPESGQETAA